MDDIEQGNLANGFLHSSYWIDYLDPLLEAMERKVIDAMKEHRTGNATEDSYLFNALQARMETIDSLRKIILADVEIAMEAGEARARAGDELSEVGLPKIEE